MSDPQFARAVYDIIAETFGADPATIGGHTTADDVEGWDSLGHAILLSRLAQRLHLEVGDDGFESKNVGELVHRLAAARPLPASG